MVERIGLFVAAAQAGADGALGKGLPEGSMANGNHVVDYLVYAQRYGNAGAVKGAGDPARAKAQRRRKEDELLAEVAKALAGVVVVGADEREVGAEVAREHATAQLELGAAVGWPNEDKTQARILAESVDVVL